MEGRSIPYVSSEKRYGDYGENAFINGILQALPSCRIKQNVIINSFAGNAEIDCLILYDNKLFAIEVKSWKGRLYECDGCFIQQKTDRWTGEVHNKRQKSPFKQLNRAIYLLKQQAKINAWVNGVVFFNDEEFEGLFSETEDIWFNDYKELVNYIKNDGKSSVGRNAEKLFNECVTADFLCGRNGANKLKGIIEGNTLIFLTPQGVITRDNIDHIKIVHHLSYDELHIALIGGGLSIINEENRFITVNDNGNLCDYALSKLDYIKIGG